MVTDQQIRRLFKLSNTEKTQEIAASKAGMDVKTARKYLRARRLPSEMKAERHWRTRKDSFAEVWPKIREQLSTNPGLEVKTIFAALQREHLDRFADAEDPVRRARLVHRKDRRPSNGNCTRTIEVKNSNRGRSARQRELDTTHSAVLRRFHC